MVTFASLVADVRTTLQGVSDSEYAAAVTVLLAMSVSRLANRCSNACFWDPGGEKIQQVFARQAIAMAWDFVEANPIGDASGGFVGQVDYLANVVANSPEATVVGNVTQHDAMKPHPVLSERPILSTDPPYYDNIDYADLSDFFYVWLRHMLRELDNNLFSTVATPKAEELVATPYRFDGDKAQANEHFTTGIRRVFTNLSAHLTPQFPSNVVYGFKQQEEADNEEGGETLVSTGWETFLESLCEARLAISGTWPLRTELVGNLKIKMNALASSIVLVCRPRPVVDARPDDGRGLVRADEQSRVARPVRLRPLRADAARLHARGTGCQWHDGAGLDRFHVPIVLCPAQLWLSAAADGGDGIGRTPRAAGLRAGVRPLGRRLLLRCLDAWVERGPQFRDDRRAAGRAYQ
jgi:adenine-specific DNA methylase